MKLYVGNLPFKTTESAIKAHFEPSGAVADVTIIMEKDSGRSRGFGFVTMETAEGGQAAINALNGKPFEDRNLIINEARAREERPERSERRDYAPRNDRGGGGGRGDYRGGGDRHDRGGDRGDRGFRSRR